MTKISALLVTICSLFVFCSCKRPECKSTNDLFNKFSPDQKEYKDELIRQLNKIQKSELTCWIDAHWNKKEKGKTIVSEHIRLHIQGDSLCAKMILVVNDANRGITEDLEDVSPSKEINFEDVHFDVIQDSLNTDFILKDIDGITDEKRRITAFSRQRGTETASRMHALFSLRCRSAAT